MEDERRRHTSINLSDSFRLNQLSISDMSNVSKSDTKAFVAIKFTTGSLLQYIQRRVMDYARLPLAVWRYDILYKEIVKEHRWFHAEICKRHVPSVVVRYLKSVLPALIYLIASQKAHDWDVWESQASALDTLHQLYGKIRSVSTFYCPKQ